MTITFPQGGAIQRGQEVTTTLQMGLEAVGFVVKRVGDGSELFNAFDLDIPDVVILDWELPGLLTGVDIIDNLRLDDRTAQLPVIMLSNHSGDVDGAQDRALKASAPWLLKVRTTPAQPRRPSQSSASPRRQEPCAAV